MSTIKLCMSCSHCVKLPDGQGMRCRKFKMVETSIARYDGYDICGKKGKYFEINSIIDKPQLFVGHEAHRK